MSIIRDRSMREHKTLLQVEAKCKSKGIDIETAYVVYAMWPNIPDDMAQNVRDHILPQVLILHNNWFSVWFVCNKETATYMNLTCDIKLDKYREWEYGRTI